MSPIPRPRQFSAIVNEPGLFVRAVRAEPRELGFACVIRETDGDGLVVRRSLADLSRASDERRLFIGEMARPTGHTRDLPCTTGLVFDQQIAGANITTLAYGNVQRRQRGGEISQFPIAAALASRLTMDDRESLAVTAVTAECNKWAERALVRAGAVSISREDCYRLHPALGTRFDAVKAEAPLTLKTSRIRFWFFPGAAIRYLLGLIYAAGSAEGLHHAGGNGPLKVRVEGELANDAFRQLLRRMAVGEIPLPVQILEVTGHPKL